MKSLKRNLRLHQVLLGLSFLLVAASLAEISLLAHQPLYLAYAIVALLGSWWMVFSMHEHCVNIRLRLEKEFAKMVMFGAAYGIGQHRLKVLHDEVMFPVGDAKRFLSQFEGRPPRDDEPRVLKFGE